jgi:hypothetical protein
MFVIIQREHIYDYFPKFSTKNILHLYDISSICKLFIFSSSLKPLNRFGPNLAEMFIWEVLYQICYFGADRKSNMATRANNVFRLVETLKKETTQPMEL